MLHYTLLFGDIECPGLIRFYCNNAYTRTAIKNKMKIEMFNLTYINNENSIELAKRSMIVFPYALYPCAKDEDTENEAEEEENANRKKADKERRMVPRVRVTEEHHYMRVPRGIIRCAQHCIHGEHCKRGKLIIGAFSEDGRVVVTRLNPPEACTGDVHTSRSVMCI